MTDAICFQIFLILCWLNPWTGTVQIQRANWICISVLDPNVKHIPSYEPVTKVGKSLMELTFQIASNPEASLLSSISEASACGSPGNSQPLTTGAPQASLAFLPCLAPWSSGAMSPVVNEGKVPVEVSWPLISLPEAQGSLLDHRMQKACLRFLAKKCYCQHLRQELEIRPNYLLERNLKSLV